MSDYLSLANAVVDADLDFIAQELEAEFARMAGKQLLILGGAGFLGHYMVQSVLHWNSLGKAAPINLTVYDSWIRGVPDWLRAREGEPHLHLVTHDVTNPMPSPDPEFDYVVHAASIASPIYYRLHPIETMDANVEGLRHLLNYALRLKNNGKPLSGFLFFSTSEIYGDPTSDNIPTPETYRGNVSCTGPRACYDESKRYGETLSVNFARQYDLPITIARPFNNYGPGLKITDRRVLSDYARDVFAGRDIEMLSSGAPTRTFCYVADAVVGYYKILVRGRAGEAYNIGNPTPEISMIELARRVTEIARREFAYTGRVVFAESDDKDYLVDNPNRRCPLIDKARSELDFRPQIDLEEGLLRSLRWYAGNRTAEDL